VKGKRSLVTFFVVLVVLLSLSLPLQYLVRREVVVGMPQEHAHSHSHAEEEHDHEEEQGHEHTHEGEDHPGSEVPLHTNLVSNYSFEVGTLEQIWGWAPQGRDQGAVVYRDDRVSRSGMASAAVNAGDFPVIDAGWVKLLDELPRGHDVVFEGYIKTEGLQGEAYLGVVAEAAGGEEEQARVILRASSDDVDGDSDWSLSRLRCYIPPEATGVWLVTGIYGRGRAWFDDLSLVVEEREESVFTGRELLKNPCFTEGTRNWHLFSFTPQPALRYGVLLRGPEGDDALFIQDVTPGAPESKNCGFYQAICGLYGHRGILTISGRLRAEGIEGTGLAGVRVFGIDGETWHGSTTRVSGDTPWREFVVSVPIDDRVTCAWVIFNLEGSGTLYVSGLHAVFQPQL